MLKPNGTNSSGHGRVARHQRGARTRVHASKSRAGGRCLSQRAITVHECARNRKLAANSLTFTAETHVDKNTINDLAGKLADAVPGELHALRDDLEKNFRSLLGSGLDKLDLVTREEFDVQRKVLERTRQKLEALEREVERLQQQDQDASPPPDGSAG